jgi:uncharacterized membrane protein
MRERNLLRLFLALNLFLAGAFAVYLFLSTSRQPKIVANTTTSSSAGKTNKTAAAPPKTVAVTNLQAAPQTNAVVAVSTNAPLPPPVASAKKFTWQDVETPDYLKYIDNLRLVGCPEEKIKKIILDDVNDLIDKKRLQEAIKHDMPWWKMEPQQYLMVNVLAERGRALEEERRGLIEKLLGSGMVDAEKSESLLWNVQLTGPVLGALPGKTHNAVQEICQRSMERQQSYQWSRFNDGQPINQVEMAKLREQTRADLRQVLTPPEVEEFTLRYSHNAHQLRMELAGMDPTPEEFRKIFRAIDAADHQMQMEFGSVEAMSPKQRERYERQRDAAIQEVLPPQRYQAYLMTKDPLYRQAQVTAMQYGAPSRAVMPIYQMTKTSETRRQQILNNAALSPQQKNEELNRVNMEHLRALQQIVSEANNIRTP